MLLKWKRGSETLYLSSLDQRYDGKWHQHRWCHYPRDGLKIDKKILQRVIDFRVDHFNHNPEEYELIMWLGS